MATAAALATLAIAMQVLVIEPVEQSAVRAARVAAAREASLAAAVIRAGGAPATTVHVAAAGSPLPPGGGVAAIGDGRVVWLSPSVQAGVVAALRLRLLALASSAVIGVTGWMLWAGVARRRSAERAARHQLEIISIVAHDLRSPLTGIVLAADRLAATALPAAQVAARAAIDRECQRLQGIADDILAVCCAAEREETISASDSLSDVLEDVAARVRNAHGCEVIVNAALDARRMRTDRRLARAVANLVENAARHSPPGSPVRLTAAADDGGVELVVEDAGAGFAPTFTIAAFRQGVHGGRAGIGLVSSRRIIELLGGSLRIRDRAGGGAAVSLRLPRRGASQ